MPHAGKVLAWIEQQDRGDSVAAFRSAAVPDRLPAPQVWPSRHQAEVWVEKEAAALGASVEWVAATPRGNG